MPSPSTKLIYRARGLAGRVRTATSALAEPDEADTHLLVLKALDSAPTTTRVPLTEARVAVAASTRLAADLAWEWIQTELSATSWREDMAAATLLVVEVVSGTVPGWPAGSPSPHQLAAEAQAHGIPAAAWVTGGSTPALLTALRASFDAVIEASPAVQVRAQTPITDPSAVRLGDVVVRHDRPNDVVADTPTVEEAVQVAATPGEPSESSPSSEIRGDIAPLLAWLARRGLVTDEWHLPDEGILPDAALSAHYDVLLDVGERSVDDVRPVLEALATRTAVVTTPDRAAHLPATLQKHVTAVEPAILRRQTAAMTGQPEMRDRIVHLAHRALIDGHTITDRARQLLDVAGAAPPPAPRTVSVVVPTNRPHEIDNILANAARQERVETELVLLAHGIDVDVAEVKAKARDLGLSDVAVVPVPADLTLGAVLNRGIDISSGAYVAKMDDDNYYGAQFLGDLVDAFACTSAGITGKWAHYVWLRSTGAVVLRFEKYENTYHRLVQGGSIVATREVADDIRFSDIPRAVDSDFLNRAMAAGVQTWSGDRFNFVSIRGTDRRHHTWQLDDLAFLNGAGRVVTYGDPRELVSI